MPSFTLRTALSAIPFVSDLCGVDVQWFQERCGVDVQTIPGKISTSFAKFQGIVSFNDFRIPIGPPRTFASFSGFLVKFLFCTDMIGSIEWPSPAPRLAYRWIVSRFAIVHWGPSDLLISSHQKFSAPGTAPTIASSVWGPCNFGPFTDLAISVFRKWVFHTVFTQILTSLRGRPLKMLHERNWRESLHVLEFRHPPNFLGILAANPGFQILHDLSR